MQNLFYLKMVLQKLAKKKLNNKKIKKNKFFLFCGSYSYWPNKLAINKIIKNKKIIKKIFPNIKLILTGEGIPNYKNKNILNLGIIKKSNLVWLIKNCLFFYAPMPKAPGTKIKILEALYYGALTVCSKNAIVGIKNTKNLKSLIITSDNKLFNDMLKIKNKKKIKVSRKFRENYNFRNNIKFFYEKINKL